MDMKRWIRFFAVALTVLMLLPAFLSQPAQALGNDQSYAYNYDLDGNALPSPDPYEVRYRIDMADLGTTRLKSAAGLFVYGNILYVCDTGNNRILQLELTGTTSTLVREITGTEEWTLSAPEDIFVTADGDMYIADTGNKRILWLDKDLKIKKIIERPDNVLFAAFSEFKPSKLVVAGGGRIYVQANGINRGLMEFDEQGEFIGFMGASAVTFDWEDYIWKLFSTDAQKSQMVSFVPTEYNNVAVDHEGLLFVTTSIFAVNDLTSGAADPVRRLNLKGSDILIRNGGNVIGDLQWSETGPSRFKDITVLENGIYYALDTTRNRIFAYDMQGNNLYVFGGYGTRSGYFKSPVALEHWNKDLIVLDSANGLITVMKQTEYGQLIDTAIDDYNAGKYSDSFENWQKILGRNGNYVLAYDNVGKILLRNGDYEQALEYLEYANDSYYYSKAWKLFRKDWIERYLIIGIVALLAFVVVLSIVKIVGRERRALEYYEEHLRERKRE